jgi:precorrin-2 dehydrogenase/sirohydrochlorin ferrochelatase
MIPLFVEFSGKRIVIFGGGGVAARKAAYFAGVADVRLVSRSFSKKCSLLPVKKQKLDVAALHDDEIGRIIRSAFLVIGALSEPEQNNRIGKLCKVKKILFNNADGQPGDVIIPSVSSGKNYTLAISTHGNSPAVSRFIREHLEKTYPSLDAMILLQDRLREELKKTESDQARRNAILREVLDNRAVWESLKANPELTWEQVRGRYLHG